MMIWLYPVQVGELGETKVLNALEHTYNFLSLEIGKEQQVDDVSSAPLAQLPRM